MRRPGGPSRTAERSEHHSEGRSGLFDIIDYRSMRRRKVASTPENYGRCIVLGLQELIAESGIDPEALRLIKIHGPYRL